MLTLRRFGIICAATLIAVACGSSKNNGYDEGSSSGGPGADGGPGSVGSCVGGKLCVGNAIHECGPDGSPGAKVGECTGKSEVCVSGECKKGCAATEAATRNEPPNHRTQRRFHHGTLSHLVRFRPRRRRPRSRTAPPTARR